MKKHLSLLFAALLGLAMAGSASAHDGYHGGGNSGHGGYSGHGGGYYGHGGYYGRGYYRGGLLFGVGFYPGYGGYPYGYGYGYPYPYYPPPPYPDAYPGRVVDSSQDTIDSQVQQALASKGYYRGRIDGLIGPASRQAIRDYQRDKGLSVTGNINTGLIKSLDLD